MSDRDPAREPPASSEERDEDEPARAPKGQRQEKVEDRPVVGTVTPEDYPEDQRAKGA
jgi:hypothetical protein